MTGSLINSMDKSTPSKPPRAKKEAKLVPSGSGAPPRDNAWLLTKFSAVDASMS